MQTRTVDLTPTWQGVLPAILAVLENGSADSRALMMVELDKMALLADLYVAGQNARKVTHA